MIMTTLIAVTIVAALLLSALVAVLSLRKRFANRELRLIGESAHVETTLTPEGTVMVDGELWPARSIDSLVISSQRRVRVVGIDDLSLLVEACDR
jgi:membrane protein implicated in regulation of membrane protease activity